MHPYPLLSICPIPDLECLWWGLQSLSVQCNPDPHSIQKEAEIEALVAISTQLRSRTCRSWLMHIKTYSIPMSRMRNSFVMYLILVVWQWWLMIKSSSGYHLEHSWVPQKSKCFTCRAFKRLKKKDEVVGSSGKTSSRYMMGAAFHHKFQIQFNLVFQNICETDLVRKLGKFPMSGIEPETNKPENSRPVC